MKLNDVVNKYKNEVEFFDALKNELIKLGTENPDFIYNPNGADTCHYDCGTENGPECKGCILGQALKNMGWSDQNELTVQLLICELFDQLVKPDLVTEDDEFMAVQTLQDSGIAWGKAIQPLLEAT